MIGSWCNAYVRFAFSMDSQDKSLLKAASNADGGEVSMWSSEPIKSNACTCLARTSISVWNHYGNNTRGALYPVVLRS